MRRPKPGDERCGDAAMDRNSAPDRGVKGAQRVRVRIKGNKLLKRRAARRGGCGMRRPLPVDEKGADGRASAGPKSA